MAGTEPLKVCKVELLMPWVYFRALNPKPLVLHSCNTKANPKSLLLTQKVPNTTLYVPEPYQVI